MLGKLIRYDFKAQLKVHLGVYLILALAALTEFILLKLQKAHPAAGIFDVLGGFSAAAFVIAMIAAAVTTFIYSIMRYRKNLLKDEGYLMHTLPVSSAQLHGSKLITSVLWEVVDCIVMGTALTAVLGNFEWLRFINGFAQVLFGMTSTENFSVYSAEIVGVEVSGSPINFSVGAMALFAVYLLIAAVTGLSQVYASLSIGYLSYSSKDLMSFVAYVITYIITQILSTAGVLIAAAADFGNVGALFSDDETALTQMTGYIGHVMIFSLILSIVLAVAYNVVSVYVAEHKLNLE